MRRRWPAGGHQGAGAGVDPELADHEPLPGTDHFSRRDQILFPHGGQKIDADLGRGQ